MDWYDRGTVVPANLHVLVRAQHERVLAAGQKLWDYLSGQPCGGTLAVKIPRHKNRPPRPATLQLRWAKVHLQPPCVGCKNRWGTTGLWAVLATELNPPQGAEPSDCLLLSDWKIDSLKMARRRVPW